MSVQQDQRRCARLVVDSQVEFRRVKEPRYAIPIGDLSPHGCRIAAPQHLGIDELVWVVLPGLESLAARVRWHKESLSGVEFARPMHPAVFDMMAERLRLAA